MTYAVPQTVAATDSTRPSRRSGMPASTWRLRSDAWEYLRFAVKRLALSGDNSDPLLEDAEIMRSLHALKTIEMYWAGFGQRYVEGIEQLILAGDYSSAMDRIGRAVHRVRGVSLPEQGVSTERMGDLERSDWEDDHDPRTRFDVLVVDETTAADRDALNDDIRRLRTPADEFIYDFVIVPSAEDAVAAILTNPNILACVVRPGFSNHTRQNLSRDMRDTIARADAVAKPLAELPSNVPPSVHRVLHLADTLAMLQPELDLYLVAGAHIESLAGTLTHRFRRLFRPDDQLELHLTLLRRVAHYFETPFFSAIQDYARRPVGVFHALPIARGGSVVGSKWISDLADFYGLNLLLAETSSTSGGLDSLLAPVHTLKKAQHLAARAFAAENTFFVTNGTSTANKIVHQAVCRPGEVVLVDRNCHKSHHYAVTLTGARVAYLEAYPLHEFAFYGAVPLSRIKRLLLDYRAAGRLDQVRMITLTNCTFDGIVYDPERVMAECLAIKPDLVFLWDEAWFAFAGFHPITRRRTGMAAARSLVATLGTAAHAAAYRAQRRRLYDDSGNPAPDEVWMREELLPAPDARIRVYVTQSTHKTLTALRQGSMIHVFDQEWEAGAREAFDEAYMTHTSTSPNYQILASLDLGRRQVELEGYALVQRQLDLATSLSQSIARHRRLRRIFRVLTSYELIPAEYRATGRPMPLRDGLTAMWDAWMNDEFVVDPSRITVDITRTGVDGDTFKHEYLMDRYGIQVNKTSRNTVLFMTNIGTSRSAIAYLVEVLLQMAGEFEQDAPPRSHAMPPLPDFSRFAPGFGAADGLPDGDMRTAFFDGLQPALVEHVPSGELRDRIERGDNSVSAGFVTPYPPGFPVLVPGQVITHEVLDFLDVLDTRETHGYDPHVGFRVLAQSDA